MTELLDWAEKAGQENMRECIEVAGVIRREANTVMMLLLSGAGAAMAFVVGSHVANAGQTGAALLTSLYLFVLAGVLNSKCLGLEPYPSAFNDPKNLYSPKYPLWELRRWELENLQNRINDAMAINNRRSEWLNRCRIAAALTPLAALIGWGAAYLAADVAPAVAALVAG